MLLCEVFIGSQTVQLFEARTIDLKLSKNRYEEGRGGGRERRLFKKCSHLCSILSFNIEGNNNTNNINNNDSNHGGDSTQLKYLMDERKNAVSYKLYGRRPSSKKKNYIRREIEARKKECEK